MVRIFFRVGDCAYGSRGTNNERRTVMNIGSAWKKDAQSGKKYLSCVIQSPFVPDGEIRFAIFSVDEKKSENAPDYTIVWNKSKPKTESAPAASSAQSDDDIPF